MNTLNTFILQHQGKVISPHLVTIREYGRWLQEYYGSHIAKLELYLRCKLEDGTIGLQYHPGTKLGKWFDKQNFTDPELRSWYIFNATPSFKRLRTYKLAEFKDTIPLSITDKQGRKMLRVYTVKQLDFYIRNNIDPSFNIASCIEEPKLVKVRNLSELQIPEKVNRRKSLF